MKRILFAAAALAAFGFNTSATAAADASATVTMGGAVADTCTMGAPVFVQTAGTATNVATTGVSTVTLGLADATTAELKASGFTLTYAGMCNYAHKVGIKATNGGLTDTGTANDPVAGSGAFVRRIGYTSSVAWAGAAGALTGPAPTTDLTTDLGDAGSTTKIEASVAGCNKGDLVVTVGVAASANPVVAGTYSETLTLKIGATI